MARTYHDPDPYRYYDPDPDPIAISTIIALAIIFGGSAIGVTALTQPNFFNNLLFTINPSLKELAEEELQTQKEFYRMLMIVGVAILAIIGLALLWRLSEKMKVRGRRRR